jgi:hypothetical protein
MDFAALRYCACFIDGAGVESRTSQQRIPVLGHAKGVFIRIAAAYKPRSIDRQYYTLRRGRVLAVGLVVIKIRKWRGATGQHRYPTKNRTNRQY